MNSTLGPERIQSARDAEPGLRSNVPFIDLSVIADRADGARGPVLRKAQLLAKFTFGADQAPYIGVGRFHRIVDRRRLDAQFLGIDQ